VHGEVIAPERLVFSNVPVDADDRAMLLGVTTVTFETVSEGTKLTVKMVAIGMHPMAARMIEGMEMGWSMTLDRLGDLVGVPRAFGLVHSLKTRRCDRLPKVTKLPERHWFRAH